ncbi:MAG TPA: exonuclease domain-containing protein [Patescibacteria group bacterium]|nr:exonuclease domain-containing protein [Patescibacteria group bacterium]
MIPARLSFIDVETTGMSPQYDRVIEVGIIRVEDAHVVAEYNKLLNPERHIHPMIQTLTGISPKEIEHAPTFAEEKDEIYELLQDSVFVAHNARFDYAFLKSEFSRFEMPFTAKQLCTARLSRLLFPRFRHHGLSALIERFGFSCKRRHRAYDDAQVLLQFYRRIMSEVEPKRLLESFNKILRRPTLPSLLNSDILDTLPESPGVYRFYDRDKVLLYVGKAIDVRARVLSHFTQDYLSVKELSLSRQVADIKVLSTAGELGALIRESAMVKREQPVYNRQLRRARKLIIAKKLQTPEGYDTVSVETVTDINAHELDDMMGMFKSKRQAMQFLEYIAEKYFLCKKLLGAEHGSGGCFGYHLNTCKGACRREEPQKKYNARFLLAFAENRMKPWYFEKPVEVVEQCSVTGETEHFILDKWCIVKSDPNDPNSHPNYPNQEENEYMFDLDTYKIIARYFDRYYFKRRLPNGFTVSIRAVPTVRNTHQ